MQGRQCVYKTIVICKALILMLLISSPALGADMSLSVIQLKSCTAPSTPTRYNYQVALSHSPYYNGKIL